MKGLEGINGHSAATALGGVMAKDVHGNEKTKEELLAAEEQVRSPEDKLDISEEALLAVQENSEKEEEVELGEGGSFKISAGKPEDSAARLMRRLVGATSQFEVRNIMSNASKDILSLRFIAAMGEGEDKAKAQQFLAKLEKLIDKASKKIENLNKEDMLRIEQVRVDQKKQADRAEQIKAELRRKRDKREREEQKWLRDSENESVQETAAEGFASFMPNAASEAEIAMQAEAQAAMEIAMETSGGFEGGDAAGFSAGAGASSDGGADAAIADAGVSVDISV